MNDRDCRYCGEKLTPDTARIYAGRWVGACRGCESANAMTRQRGGTVRPRRVCPGCGIERAVNADGTLFRHQCSGGRRSAA